jgi:hypothetical protein
MRGLAIAIAIAIAVGRRRRLSVIRSLEHRSGDGHRLTGGRRRRQDQKGRPAWPRPVVAWAADQDGSEDDQDGRAARPERDHQAVQAPWPDPIRFTGVAAVVGHCKRDRSSPSRGLQHT